MKRTHAYPFVAALIASQSLPAATLTWSGSTSGAWDPTIPANWNNVAPTFDNTADVVFNATTPITNYVTFLGNGPRTVRSILCQGTFASPLEIRTNNNSTTARILHFSANAGNATLTIDPTVSQTVHIGQGSGANNIGTVNLVSDLSVAHNGTGNLTISRPISEGSAGRSITKSGSGTLVLSAANTYSGITTINAGIVQLGNAAALGATAGDTAVNSGGTLDLNNQRLPTGESVSIVGTGQGGIGALYQTTGDTGDAISIADGLILTGDASVGAAAGARYGVGSNGASTTGLFTLTKVGAGQFDLRGNVNIGDIVVNQGRLQTQAAAVYNTGFTVTLNPGTEFRAFEISNPFPRDIILNNAKIFSAGSTAAGDVIAGNLTLSGANSFESNGDAADKLSFTGDIGESAPGASIAIGGNRRIVLSGTNSYTGATNVGTGTLQASGSFTSDISVAGFATLDGEGVTTGSLTLGDGSNFLFDPATTGANQFFRAADVIIDSGQTVTVAAKSASSGSGIVILRDGNGGLDLANFFLLNAGRASLSLGGAGGNSDLLYNFQAANLEWRGFNGNNWGTQDTLSNFQNLGTAAPDDFYDRDNVDFVDAATGTILLSGTTLAGNLTFKNTTGNDVLLQAAGAVTLDAVSVTKTSSGNVTIEVPLAGPTPVTVNGSGTLILSAANTSTGTITVNSGTLQIGGGSTSGSVAAPIINNSSVVANRSDNLTIGTVISGPGTFTQAGTGLTILTGENTYTGLTTASAGILQIGNGATGSIAGDVLNNATFDFNRSNEYTYDGTISGTGVVNKRGTGILTLTGIHTFGGGLNIYNGTLIAGDENIGPGPVTLGPGLTNPPTWSLTGGTVDNDIFFSNGGSGVKVINLATGVTDATLSGTIHFDSDSAPAAGVSRISPLNGTIVISGKMTGAGLAGYAKRQPGTVVITNNTNDYTGPTHIVDPGTLIVDGRLPGNVFFGEQLGVGGTGAVNGTLAGAGTIVGNVKLQNNSRLSPGGTSSGGVNADTQAILTINGNLDATLIATGTGRILMQLSALAGPNDRINVGGTLALGADAIGLTEIVPTNAGGLEAGVYTLISASGGITGTLDPANVTGEIAPGMNGTLSISGNNLILTIGGTGNPYAAWAAGFPTLTNTDFEFDFDGDGFKTGLEWVLGGNPTVNDALAIVPTVTGNATNGLTLNFDREEDSIGVATLTVEYGSVPGDWPGSATIGATSSTPNAHGVAVTVNDVPSPDAVTVGIPAINAAAGKLFARLKATMP